MADTEGKMSGEEFTNVDCMSGVKKPKKRSLVERELETNLTARVTSPVTYGDGVNTSRYGRARRIKNEDQVDRKPVLNDHKSPGTENTPVKIQSPVYKMHAINSPYKSETPKRALETTIDNQIDSIYQENISLSRFHSDKSSPSSAKKSPKVYIRKDLIQTKDSDDDIVLIKNLFSPPKSNSKSHINNILECSSEKYSSPVTKQVNGHLENASVVKMLDFDGKKKKKKENKDKTNLSKNEVFDVEAQCFYQVGDLAWARMGTFPFWPCIVTRDPMSGMFVKKKLFGRVEHDIVHVTFFGDNGRRSWIVDNMLRKFQGLVEFENTREQFTLEAKKKDPRLYAAFFISEKKQELWNMSVEEAEMLMREPKRLRIDILNDMILRSRASKKQQKSGKITRTNSDVSLSESLYDSLFSEDDTKTDDTGRLRKRSRNNKSLDVSEVVTACLDNMAAKTGITKIQKQSHMDRWLQKAKSKTPEKTQTKLVVPKVERKSTRSKKKASPKTVLNPYSLRKGYESRSRETKYTPDSSLMDISYNDVDSSGIEDVKPSIDESLINDVQENSFVDDSKRDCSDITIKKELIEQENAKNQDHESMLLNNMEIENDSLNIDAQNTIDVNSNDSMSMSETSKVVENDSNELQVPKDNIVLDEVKIKSEIEDFTEDSIVNNNEKENHTDENNDQTDDSSISKDNIENTVESPTIVDDEKENNEQNVFLDDSSTCEQKQVEKSNESAVFLGEPVSLEGNIDYENKINSKENANLNNEEPNLSKDNVDISEIEEKNEGMINKRVSGTKVVNEIDELLNKSIDSESLQINGMECTNNVEKTFDICKTSNNTTDIDSELLSSESILEKIDEIINPKMGINMPEEKFFREQCLSNVTSKPNTRSSVQESKVKLKEIEDKIPQQYIDEEFYSDESDDEPSPEYEPLGEDITEDFRKHMMTFESSIKDPKDEKQIVKICEEIAKIVEKTNPVKSSLNLSSKEDISKSPVNEESNKGVKTRSKSGKKTDHVQINEIINHEPKINIDKLNYSHNQVESKIHNNHSKTSKITEPIITKEPCIENAETKTVNKTLIDQCKSDPKVMLVPIDHKSNSRKKSIDTKIPAKITKIKDKTEKTPPQKQHFKLSLKKNKTPTQPSTINIEKESPKDQISTEKPKLKEPKILPIDNHEITIPESKTNGYHSNRQCADTPEINEDDDFNIDAESLNSEDSDVSSTNANYFAPRRSTRSRPYRRMESSLDNPHFLHYLELRQDYVMDEHPDLTQDEVVAYLYKTWAYEEDLKIDVKKTEEVHQTTLVKGIKQETPKSKNSKKTQPKNQIENYFREKYNKKKIDFDAESSSVKSEISESSSIDNASIIDKPCDSISTADSGIENSKDGNENDISIAKEKSPITIDLIPEIKPEVTEVPKETTKTETELNKSKEEIISTPKRSLRSKTSSPRTPKVVPNETVIKIKEEKDFDTESTESQDSEIPLLLLRSKTREKRLNGLKSPEIVVKAEVDDVTSLCSDDEPLNRHKKKKNEKKVDKQYEEPEFLKFLELRQDALMDENPQLTQEEIVDYLYKTWLYEENSKSEEKKNDEIEQSSLVKGLNPEIAPKKTKRKPKTEKIDKPADTEPIVKEKPKRKTVQPFYNEDFYSDTEDIELFEIFKKKPAEHKATVKTEPIAVKTETDVKTDVPTEADAVDLDYEDEVEFVDEIELYFTQLTQPKPNVFKGLIREKVCEICEKTGNLYKCKSCNGMFHVDCVTKARDIIEPQTPTRGRKKKKKVGRKQKGFEDSESQGDEKPLDISEETQNVSVEEVTLQNCTFDAETIEAQISAKMKEILESNDTNYDSYSSDEGVDWTDSVAGKCEIINVKLKPKRIQFDDSEFKCHNCQNLDTPICFVCKSAVTKSEVKIRQKCHVAHCHKYYHLECLDHWPQTQFNGGEPSKSNKKNNEHFEALTCPRHVCHTCVSDDPRGCKTRFSGDKLARCVRCPATYHSFNKCLPAGSQILTASQIICPRHYQHRPGKVPCHVNTGWCFICALGGSLICCEYCPTSFHAECLNIKPPEGNYMCEDCETGRLPLYGEMVWVKLGHYRWWPGIILHPSEIPNNIMAVKHSLGEFVVRFFGQYDHYWVNRGRVFPYQEGDSGRISSQKSKIDAAFTTAMEHAQRAFEILKTALPNPEESQDIAMSLLPPHYVKLRSNKPCGALGARRDDPALSLTQCECDPAADQPCGPYSHCLNRMLLTECGPTCGAGERCCNRAFEKRQYPRLAPHRAPHRGWGLRTLEDIKAGQFVIEYVGELIDEEEFKRRMRRKHEIRDENYYFLTLDKERMIDAGPKGNLARFMNHCCEPNCETQKWTVLGDVRVGLFAINDIPANSEVTFNYNLQCAGIEKKRCLCGAKRCSGYIGAKPKQDEPQIKKGKDGKPIAKRAYRKRKNIEESPSTAKMKPKRPLGRPPKPKELTEIEKDLIIIQNATANTSSDECSGNAENQNALKRKRTSNSTEEASSSEPKRQKCASEVGD